MRSRPRRVAVLFAISTLPLCAQQLAHGTIPHTDCVPDQERARIEAAITAFAARLPPMPQAGTPVPYPFVPVGGNLWDDLHVYNYVDVDTTSGVRDYECTDWAYDAHRGHDIHIGSFAEMDRGVPVFAALSGEVVDTHDGEPDRNTQPNSNPSNYVILWHGGTQYSWYLHLRRNSVAVAIGQRVAAGQQLGLVGSSGNSSWPHLHFESWHDNAHYEPSAGPCRAGNPHWVSQPARRSGLWVGDFAIGPGDFHAQQPLPNDYARQATWGTGWQYIGFWFQYHNLPANATARVRYLRPDGSVAVDSGTGPFGGNSFRRFDWVWFRWWVDCNQTGRWQIELTLAGAVVATMPFDVVANPVPPLQRAPEALAGVVLEPPAPQPGDVLWCRAQSGLLRDRDHDVVSYHWVWRRNGVVVRDVTHAGRADCLRDDALLPAATVQCTVTPTDGVSSAPPSTAAVVVGSGPALELVLRGAGHADGSGKPMTVAQAPRSLSFAPDAGAVPILGVSMLPCGAGSPFPQTPPCTLPAGVLLPDLARGPLLTVFGQQVVVPVGTPWCYCVQGAELVSGAGPLCVKFTGGYHLLVHW